MACLAWHGLAGAALLAVSEKQRAALALTDASVVLCVLSEGRDV